MELAGATVLVTGGRGGLGSRTCEAFLDAGASVMAADVAPVGAGRLVDGVAQIQADTSTAAGAQAAVDAAVARFGRLDVLVNNAGIKSWVGERTPLRSR